MQSFGATGRNSFQSQFRGAQDAETESPGLPPGSRASSWEAQVELPKALWHPLPASPCWVRVRCGFEPGLPPGSVQGETQVFSSKTKYVTRVQGEAEVVCWGQGPLGGKGENVVDWMGLRRAWELSWVCAWEDLDREGVGRPFSPTAWRWCPNPSSRRGPQSAVTLFGVTG